MVVDPQPLIDAAKAAIAAQGLAVGVGVKPAVASGLPWAVMWPDAGNVTDRSLRSRDGFTLTLPVQCYGLSPASAAVAVRKVRTAIEGLGRQAVGGRTVQPPSHQPPPPLTRDDDADPPVFMHYDEWRITTTP